MHPLSNGIKSTVISVGLRPYLLFIIVRAGARLITVRTYFDCEPPTYKESSIYDQDWHFRHGPRASLSRCILSNRIFG